MSAIRDLFADFDAAPTPIAEECQPIAPDRQPDQPICQPTPPGANDAPAWAYRPQRGTPAGVIVRACLCGAQDERPGPDLSNVACWKCHQADTMRPLPWRPTPAEMARGVMR